MNYININKHSRPNNWVVSSKHPMFSNEYLIVKLGDGFISMSVPIIDYNGKLYKTSVISKYGWRSVCVHSYDLSPGKYLLDESESSEDLAVFDVASSQDRSKI